jgi:hypothetical protein
MKERRRQWQMEEWKEHNEWMEGKYDGIPQDVSNLT